jgi:ferritin
MISKKMAKALIDQVNAETYSAYLYLAMASCAKHKGLDGVAKWFTVQAKEETKHAEKFAAYLNDQNELVVLDAIAKPPSNWDSVSAMFKAALGHEKKITSLINSLVKLAREEKDNATEFMLQWFVTEQVEEEKNDVEVLTKLDLIGEKGAPLYMLDIELGKRE